MEVFRKLDADGDGFLVKSELQTAMKGVLLTPTPTPL